MSRDYKLEMVQGLLNSGSEEGWKSTLKTGLALHLLKVTDDRVSAGLHTWQNLPGCILDSGSLSTAHSNLKLP